MDSPRITYTSRPDATPEAEVNVLANVYRFIFDCHVKKMAAEPAPEPDGHDEAKEWKHGCAPAVAYLGRWNECWSGCTDEGR
jgi:hypothetical protein